MNSWLSLIKSSVKPLSLRSLPKCSRHNGSKASSSGNSEEPRFPFIIVELACDGAGGGGGRFARVASGVGADEWRWNSPPSRLCLCAGCCEAPPNGVDRVALLAFFSRSSIFFLNCLASFSSTKLRPARHSSSSNVWKNVRSWL